MEFTRAPRSRFDGTPRSFGSKPFLSPIPLSRTLCSGPYVSVPQSGEMDETTLRSRATGRRMASTKTTATTRRSSSGRGPGAGGEEAVSPARWGGVALVITALVGAIILAVISPTDPGAMAQPGSAAVEATPTPMAGAASGADPADPAAGDAPTGDGPLPLAKPSILSAIEVTDEIDIRVKVQVPEEEIPDRDLVLVVFSGDREIGSKREPRTGKSVSVPVRLIEDSVNELTAALQSAAGLGPASEPVTVIQDSDVPGVEITSPASGEETYAKTVQLVVSSEPGATVRIRNRDNEPDRELDVGPSGELETTVPLALGRNRIVVIALDRSGRAGPRDRITIARRDGTPRIELKAPARVSRDTLASKGMRITVRVTDDRGEPMEGASVLYTLGGPIPATTWSDEVGPDGTSVWRADDLGRPSSSAESLLLGVTVVSPDGVEAQAEPEAIALK